MATWTDVVSIGQSLPQVQECTSYRTPALKVAGRLMVRLRAESDGALVVMCDPSEKQALLAEGGPFYTTDHYAGHGSILIRLGEIGHDRLAELLTDAWRLRAPVRVREQRD